MDEAKELSVPVAHERSWLTVVAKLASTATARFFSVIIDEAMKDLVVALRDSRRVMRAASGAVARDDSCERAAWVVESAIWAVARLAWVVDKADCVL